MRYREFLALYPSAPQRRGCASSSIAARRCTAWYTAVTVNSVASYRYFLGEVRRDRHGRPWRAGLMERAGTRALLASTDPAALGLQVASTCNCSVPPTRRADSKSDKKSARNAQAQQRRSRRRR